MDAKPYSVDLRKSVVAAIEGGMSRNKQPSSLGSLSAPRLAVDAAGEQTGGVAAGQMGGGDVREHAAWLSQRIRAGDCTLRGLVAELAGRGLKVNYRVHAEKLSFKKSVAAGERDRPDVARRHVQ